jgi:hypothetical protein
MDIHIFGCHGLGDNIYQRPAIKWLADNHDGKILLNTPWPELYWDIPRVKFTRPGGHLRTQMLNVKRWDKFDSSIWTERPTKKEERKNFKTVRLSYGPPQMKKGLTPMRVFLDQLGINAVPDGMLTLNPSWVSQAWRVIQQHGLNIEKDFGMVHFPTVRKEWSCPARSPRVKYMQHLLNETPELNWLSFAWLEEDKEWWKEQAPQNVRWRFEKGEIAHTTLIALMQLAKVTLSSPCWTIPVAGLTQAKLFLVFGGHAAPNMVIDETFSKKRIKYIAPDPVCGCVLNNHNCNTKIRGSALIKARATLREQIGE